MKSTKRVFIALLIALGIVAGAMSVAARGPDARQDRPETQAATTPPNLTGLWILNEDASDRPPDRGRGADSGERPPRGGGGGGGYGGFGGGRRRGGFGGGDRGGGGRSREDMERARAAMAIATRAAKRLTIVRDESTVVLTDEDGRSVRLTADGKKNKSTIDGQDVETTSKWNGAALHVERKFKSDVKVVDEFSLAPDPQILVVATKIEGMGGRAFELRRVYDRQEPH
jgi:hypothetical protein